MNFMIELELTNSQVENTEFEKGSFRHVKRFVPRDSVNIQSSIYQLRGRMARSTSS